MKNRNFPIDVLKTIGLLCIMLAHVNPPDWIFQLRQFDVPLVVIVSWYLFSLSQNSQKETLREYFRKRCIRLVLPTWIFLAIFFWSFWMYSQVKNTVFPFTFHEIKSSIFLWKGIGYVWIIRVYLMISIFWPLWLKLLQKTKLRYLIIVLLYILYELLLFYFLQKYGNWSGKKYVLWTFFYLYAYFFFFYFGSILPKIKKRYIWFLALVWGIITFFHANSVWWFFSPEFVLQSMKYPPHMYYNSYSITISSLLFLIMPFFKILRFEPLKFTFSFISSSSLWIYLWHIFPVYILSTYFPDMNFLYQFGLIISFSLSVVILQKGLIIWILECCKVSPEKRKIIIQILCS